jgi:hypothetical protein
MKQLFTCIIILFSISLFAQKRAYVLHDSLNGQINKVEVRFFKLSYDKSGRLIKKPDISNTKVVYQLDDQHNIIRDERWFDYSSLDPTGKTKPKSTINNYTISNTPIPKYDTSKSETDTSFISMIKLGQEDYEYEYRVVNKKDLQTTWVAWTDKNGGIVGTVRFHYDEQGQLLTKSQFYSPAYTKVLVIENYNNYGFLHATHHYNSDGSEYMTREYKYQYDDWGNYTIRQMFEKKEGSSQFAPMSEEEYYYSYNGKAPSKQKAEKVNEPEEKKEKKSLKDRLNIFKKKDGN